MIEKRFILVKCYNEQWGVVDKSLEKTDQLVLITTSKSGTGYLVNELNKLNEENEQLKQQDKINEDCYKKLLQKYDDLKKENERYKKNSISLKQLYKILEENKEHFLSLSECFSEKLFIKTIFRNIDEDIESREEEE